MELRHLIYEVSILCSPLLLLEDFHSMAPYFAALKTVTDWTVPSRRHLVMLSATQTDLGVFDLVDVL